MGSSEHICVQVEIPSTAFVPKSNLFTRVETKFFTQQTKITASNTTKEIGPKKFYSMRVSFLRYQHSSDHDSIRNHIMCDNGRKVLMYNNFLTQSTHHKPGTASMEEGNTFE
jgi:hypothetical protein